jgi:endonuclease/exonuclease/phosphatase family metal-dependent hydrolase
MKPLRILSWNIHANCGISNDRLDRVAAAISAFDADIVLLQEVSNRSGIPERLRTQLALPGWYFSGTASSEKAYGNVVASRYPVSARSYQTTPAAPWPELLAYATVATPVGSVEVVSAHMPNGSDKNHGWKKIDTFDALASMLAQVSAPWIVGGDFNEPRTVFKGNQVISFGADEDGVVEGTWRGQPNSRWQASVARILQPTKTNVHTWLSRNESIPAATHVVRGIDRFFDHLLTSEHFDVLDAGFEHTWRAGADPMSDHSAAWASLSKKAQAPMPTS